MTFREYGGRIEREKKEGNLFKLYTITIIVKN